MPEKVQYPEIWCGWQMSGELRMLSVGALGLEKRVLGEWGHREQNG